MPGPPATQIRGGLGWGRYIDGGTFANFIIIAGRRGYGNGLQHPRAVDGIVQRPSVGYRYCVVGAQDARDAEGWLCWRRGGGAEDDGG